MRVAIFTETFLPKFDGIVRILCLLLDHFAKQGIDVAVIAPSPDKNLKQYNGAQIIGAPGFRNFLYPEHKVGFATPSTYHEIKKFNPDIAHLIHPVFVGLPGFVMARQMRIPTLVSFHLDYARIADHYKLGFLRPGINWLTRAVFNAADYRLAPSTAIQQELYQLGIQNVDIWRRGVDIEQFHPRFRNPAMREEMSNGNPEDILLLYVGRLSKEKQIEHIRPVLETIPNTRLALVGDGPARQQLEATFSGTHAKFIGFLENERLSQAYASADIFVFPSAMETFGLVLTEAMAAGLPVVASRVGGAQDVVKEGFTGYTFVPGDTMALIENVRKIALYRDRIREMGKEARRFAETQTWETSMQQVVEIYRNLIVNGAK